MRRLAVLILAALMALLLAACTSPTTIPIGTVRFPGPPAADSRALLVLLPGLRDRPTVFAEEGFTAAVRSAGVAVEMIGVDAHLGYYVKKKFLRRMKDDVIAPARRKGYTQIWLAGVSLGGFGALWYDLENPGDLTGVIALAPYLGEPDITGEVARAGGLAAWRPPDDAEIDDQEKIWRGLKRYLVRENAAHRVYLGYGLGDKFAAADGLLAAALPRDQVFTVEGGHDWQTWQTLWERILRQAPLPRR